MFLHFARVELILAFLAHRVQPSVEPVRPIVVVEHIDSPDLVPVLAHLHTELLLNVLHQREESQVPKVSLSCKARQRHKSSWHVLILVSLLFVRHIPLLVEAVLVDFCSLVLVDARPLHSVLSAFTEPFIQFWILLAPFVELFLSFVDALLLEKSPSS